MAIWTPKPNDPLAVAKGDLREARAETDAEAAETKLLQRQLGEMMSWVAAIILVLVRGEEVKASQTGATLRLEIPNPAALGIKLDGLSMRTIAGGERIILELRPSTDMRARLDDALADGGNAW